MLQALWSLEVLKTEGPVPAGVLIFHLRRVFGDYYQRGRLFGGDAGATYVGDYEIENLGLKGRFAATRLGAAPTPFGGGDRHDVTFTAVLDAHLERDVLRLEARVDDDTSAPIELRLTKRAPL
jgi:hypothetical protein